MNQVDLTLAKAVLTEIIDELQQIDGAVLDDKSGKNDKAAALLSKRLNRVADLCELAATLVRQEYWAGKGFKDPTTE